MVHCSQQQLMEALKGHQLASVQGEHTWHLRHPILPVLDGVVSSFRLAECLGMEVAAMLLGDRAWMTKLLLWQSGHATRRHGAIDETTAVALRHFCFP